MKYLVIDIGGTLIKYAIMDEHAEILEKHSIPTPNEKGDTVHTLIETLGTVYDKYKGSVCGIAVSIPGFVDSETGYCRTGGYLHYNEGQPVGELLQKRCNIPVTLENDGKCAALAELKMGSLKGCKNGAVILLGSGVGGGIVVDGKIQKGLNFTAGEISFIAINETAYTEEDGFLGFACGNKKLCALAEKYSGIPAKEWDGRKIFEKANAGDQNMIKALEDFTKVLAMQIYNLNIILDLEIIAIGGGISRQPLLLEILKKQAAYFTEHNGMGHYAAFMPKPNLAACTFFNDANLIGALNHFQMSIH